MYRNIPPSSPESRGLQIEKSLTLSQLISCAPKDPLGSSSKEMVNSSGFSSDVGTKIGVFIVGCVKYLDISSNLLYFFCSWFFLLRLLSTLARRSFWTLFRTWVIMANFGPHHLARHKYLGRLPGPHSETLGQCYEDLKGQRIARLEEHSPHINAA